MFDWLRKLLGSGRKPGLGPGRMSWPRLLGRYDAAATTSENFRHWQAADGLSANSANSSEVRRTLRNRARYEVANNSYAKGIVLTLAGDVVGTGPRLQMLLAGSEDAKRVEAAFSQWAAAVGLAAKLRTMREAQSTDGESFGILTSNSEIDSPVKLDLRLVEADQVTTPEILPATARAIDGIEFDRFGNPEFFHVLKEHPGNLCSGFGLEYDRFAASSIVHLYRADRPGQARGIPELTPALPLFAQLRRYTLAVLGAAETAAEFAGILYTDAPANGEADELEPMDSIELEKRMLLTMPGGWKMEQVRAEQPSTKYAEFKHEVLNEIARCLNMPFNIAAGNSSGYNYASGRLDHQTYFKSIRIDQAHIASTVLDPVFGAWLSEAALVEGLLPQSMRRIDADISHQWFWDGVEHVDPLKEARAQSERLSNSTTTLADEYARKGQDWEVQLRQRAREKQLMKQLGLSASEVAAAETEEVA
jgi:lambda family phage portal protein